MLRLSSRFTRLLSFPTSLYILRRAAHSAPFPSRTHNCGQITPADVGSDVVLAGWLLPRRKISKNLSFFPLKDSYGVTQLVIGPKKDQTDQELLLALTDVPIESVVLVQGTVRSRPEKDARSDQLTGLIEVAVNKFTVLNAADRNLPFFPSDSQNLANEDLRSRHRYLDLRRPALSDNLRKRSKVANIVRTTLNEEDFLEIETPILLKSTPEGAREFLVPTRLPAQSSAPPLFYSLPQSPQQPKQLLICSGGVDKYYQLARCFRDEDGRKDRQPEFTQIDLEMAFVSWNSPTSNSGWRIGGHEVRQVTERLIKRIWNQVEGIELSEIDVITYGEAMARFGSDKPDNRFGLEIENITSHISSLQVSDQVFECIVLRKGKDTSFQGADLQCQGDHEAGLERIVITEQNLSSWWSNVGILNHRSGDAGSSECRLYEHLRLCSGDVIWLSRRRAVTEGSSTPLGRLRLRLSELSQSNGQLILPSEPHFIWITEFPLFTHDEDKVFQAHDRWSSSHHPFTAPMWEDIPALYEGRYDQVRGQHYDLVLDGVEIGGGSVRIHDPKMQEYIFSVVLQLDDNERQSFDHLLHALKCGAPPHGGIALGFDRLMSILCKTSTIRDVIAFPKSGRGTDLLFNSPAPVKSDVLKQYGIKISREYGTNE